MSCYVHKQNSHKEIHPGASPISRVKLLEWSPITKGPVQPSIAQDISKTVLKTRKTKREETVHEANCNIISLFASIPFQIGSNVF